MHLETALSNGDGGAGWGRSAIVRGSRRIRTAGTAALCLLLCSAAAPAATGALDQSPILRVVRVNDLPTAENLEMPSGALTAHYFALNNNPSHASAAREERFLAGAGFRSSAISAFVAGHRQHIKSTAIEFETPADAAAALSHEVSLATSSQRPEAAHAVAHADHAFDSIANASIVSFNPGHTGWAGGIEILAAAGTYIYALREWEKPDRVSRAAIERLLKTVITRE